MLRRGNRRDAGVTRYVMRQKALAIGDDYWVEDENGDKVFKVDGKALRVRDTWELLDAQGAWVARIKERKLAVRDTLKVDLGNRTATVKKALVGIRDRIHVEVEGEPDLRTKGNVVDHEYTIERDGQTVAEISKRWFRARDTYGIEIQPGVDPALVIAVTVAIDSMGR